MLYSYSPLLPQQHVSYLLSGGETMLTHEQREQNYIKQNNGRPLTTRQKRQLRRTDSRRDHEQARSVHREKKRNARQRFREWMAGIR